MNPSNLKYALLAELLRTLEAEGFAFGVDKHLQLQQLLAQLPDDLSSEQLKQSLAPAIATNEQEQSFFYLLFDQAWARVQAVNDDKPIDRKTSKIKSDAWLLPTIATLGLLLLPLLWMIFLPPVEDLPAKIVKSFTAYPDSTYTICLEEERLAEIHPIQSAYFCANGLRSDSTVLGKFTLTDSLCLQYTANDTIIQDSICVRLIGDDADTLTVFFRPELIEVPSEIAEDTASIVPPRVALFEYKDYPLPTDILSLKTAELTHTQSFYLQHYRKLKLLFALLATLLTALILLRRARKRRKLVAEVQERNSPPFIWNIETPSQTNIDVGRNFGTLLNSLRKRTESDHKVFDAEKTITATVEGGGIVDFQYAAQTRPPEYLLLLDRESGDSQRTSFYDYLYHRFLENEVFIHRFFYDNDLRRAWNEQHSNGLSLKELGRLHPDARLIIVGNAYQLLSPMSGKLAKWARVLTQWKERALLTYVASNNWGRREKQLEKELIVLPASMQCLHFLLDQWDQGEEAEFEKWCDVVDDAPAHPIIWQGKLMATLRQYYSPELVRWIAACAVYPSLHWDTTLFIGEQLSTHDNSLLSLANLQKLHRLDWFVQGEIPREARAELLEWLETNEAEILQQTRKNLDELLRQNPPPEESVAFEDYKMQRDLNEWLITTDKGRKRKLEDEIAKQLEQGIEPDYTILKYLDRPRTRLDFVVPSAWKKFVYNSGFKGLGLRKIQRDLMWATPILVTALACAYLWSPNMLLCEGEEMVFLQAESEIWQNKIDSLESIIRMESMSQRNSNEDTISSSELVQAQKLMEDILQASDTFNLHLCLENSADSILYAEHYARLLVNNKELEAAQAVSSGVAQKYQLTAHTPLLDHAYKSYHKNLAIDYWNAAIPFHQIAMQLSNPRDSVYLQNQDSACFYFQYAYELDSTEVDMRRAKQYCENGDFQAYFEMSPADCCAPCPVTFTNYSLGASRIEWQFGDGQISTENEPTHRYRTKGDYEVKLTIYNEANASTNFIQRLSICAGKVSPPPRSNTVEKDDVKTPSKDTIKTDTVLIEDPKIDPPVLDDLAQNGRFNFQWLSPQQNVKTTTESYTISIDIVSNRSLKSENIGMYYNGNLLRPRQQVLFGGSSPTQQQSIVREVYTYRQTLRLSEGNNTFQLVILDARSNILSESAERNIQLESELIDADTWQPIYLELPYLGDMQKYEEENYNTVLRELRDKENIAAARNNYSKLIEQVANAIDNDNKLDCTLSIQSLSSEYDGKIASYARTFYLSLLERSIRNSVKEKSYSYTEDSIRFIMQDTKESQFNSNAATPERVGIAKVVIEKRQATQEKR